MLSARASQLNTDSAYFPTKTPGRNLKNRIENAGRPGAMTVNGKGKNGVSRTPFHPASTRKPSGLRIKQNDLICRGCPVIQGPIYITDAGQTYDSAARKTSCRQNAFSKSCWYTFSNTSNPNCKLSQVLRVRTKYWDTGGNAAS